MLILEIRRRPGLLHFLRLLSCYIDFFIIYETCSGAPENYLLLTCASFSILQQGSQSDHLIIEAADSLMSLKRYESALKYYMMLDRADENNRGHLHLKIAQCCLSMDKNVQAIEYLYKAVHRLEDTIDARLTLSSLLVEDGKYDEAISVLSPPVESESSSDQNPDKSKSWWLSGKIKLKLCRIYKDKGLLGSFVDVILPVVRETLLLETVQQKVPAKRKLSRSVLSERIEVVNECQTDQVFHGFRPVASASDLAKASRARRVLQKKATFREAKRAATLAAGIDWASDDSGDESPQVLRELPLPNLLKDDEHHLLILDLCKALSSLQRYWEALEVINLTLKLARNTLSVERKEELRMLRANVAYNTLDPTNGFDSARYIVTQHPYSLDAWNCYYKVISRLGSQVSKHNKFLRSMRIKFKDCVPPIIISGHQFTSISQHQIAAREYLEAYKLLPDNPFINLCAGSALINLALGFRLQNKHQCVMQGLAFLHNNLRLSDNSQEALYNVARAYHHVGLVSFAVIYYEKVLAIHEKDFPIPILPNEDPNVSKRREAGYCDLRREAAYNLHLIYKNSGALDLSRQVLRDYCSF